jgi:hypothetical protein
MKAAIKFCWSVVPLLALTTVTMISMKFWG